jgi:hypothetical protein
MMTFTIHQPPEPPADRDDRAADLVFIRDGFSWLVFLFAPFWLLANRLWLALGVYVGLFVVIEGVLLIADAPDQWSALAITGLNLMTAFEAASIKRWTLERNGWTTLGTVSGRTELDCERRFFDGWLPNQPLIAPSDSSFGRLSSVASGSRWSSLPWKRT